MGNLDRSGTGLLVAARQKVVTLEGLPVLLVVDFGGSERNVTPKQMKRWGKSREEIWETALLRSAQHAASALEAFDLSREDGSGQLLQLMSSPSNFTAVMGLRVSKDLAGDGISVVLGLHSWCNVLLRQLDGTARRSNIEKMAAMVATTCLSTVTVHVNRPRHQGFRISTGTVSRRTELVRKSN